MAGCGGGGSSSEAAPTSDPAAVPGRSCSNPASTGWCWQRPLPQGNQIVDYHFVSDTQGWAVGEVGTILVTTDGGLTWARQDSHTDMALGKVIFTDAQSGWVASTNGQVLRTTDGGAHWQALSVGPADASMLGASSADRAWVGGRLFGTPPWTTQDGGAHWAAMGRAVTTGTPVYGVISATEAWAVDTHDVSSLLHTIDAGLSWAIVSLPPSDPALFRSLHAQTFIDSQHGWILFSESGYPTGGADYVARMVALRTADGGASWQAFSGDTSLYGNGYTLRFLDGSNGFVSAAFGNAVQRTTDGGSTWQPVTLPWSNGTYYTMFRAFSPQRLLIQDAAGRAFLSTDGGTTWSDRSANGPARATVNSVWFFDALEGVAFADDGSSLRTADGGRSWVDSPSVAGAFGWRRAQFAADASVGWVISDSGAIYRSTDKGRSWLAPVPQGSASPLYASDFHFVDTQRGWAVSPYPNGSDATVFRTTDGGSSWQAVTGSAAHGGLASVRFADPQHGIAVGPAGYVLVTADGGLTWEPRASGTDHRLRRVTFVDAQTAVAVGDFGTVLRSTDLGATWSKLPSVGPVGLNDVRFVSPRFGVAVGDSGSVFVSRDGGLSWRTQPTAVSASLYGVFFSDERTGWIVGTNGTVLTTVTGGD